MYDMPDDEILGFWGKRPFLAKRFPKEPATSTSAKALVLSPLPESLPETAPAIATPLTSWHTDPHLMRHSQPAQEGSDVTGQA
jgi:hypothetical protein